MSVTKKIISLILTAVMLVTTCSAAFPVFAEGSLLADGVNEDEFYLPEESDVEAYILSEVTEKREENAKHFLMSDGSFMVAQYNEPVHELDNDGNWIDIDNTIAEAEATTEQTELFGTDELYSTSNITDNVVFAEKSNSNTLVSYEAKEYPISFNYQSAKKSYINVVDNETVLEGDEAFLTLTDITQEVIYEDVFADVDLQYIVSPTGLKENIILKSESAQNSFTVNYNIGELTAEVVDSNTINLMAGDEVVYTISAPYMTDANGEKSEAVTLIVEKNKNGKLRLVVSADENWLNAEDRVYPVVVDPSIVEKEDNDLVATFVSSAAATTNYGDVGSELYISKGDSTYGTSYALLKLEEIEGNVYADHVVSAKLNLPLKSALSSSLKVYLYEITSAWDETTVTWNSKPTVSNIVSDYCKLTASSESISFDITKLYYQWSDDENINGVALKLNDAGAISFSSQNIESPVLLLNYISTVGIDEDFSYTEFNMGSAGYVYINNLSGNLVIARDDVDTTGKNYSYDFTRTYNSLGNLSGRDSIWINSYDSTIFSGLLYMDSDGSAKPLNVEESANEKLEITLCENEFGWEKIKILDYYTITIPRPTILGGDLVLKFPNTIDAWKNNGSERYRFDLSGLIEQSVGANTETERIVFFREATYNEDGTKNNNLFYVVDGDGHKLEISETETSYSVKQVYTENTTIVNGDTLVYSKDNSGNVTQITLNGNIQAVFTYDELNRMTSVTNDIGYKLTFGYQGNSKKIASVSESKDGTEGQSISFTRTYNSTEIRSAGADGVYGNNDDVITTYKFNKEAQLTQVQNKTYVGEDLGAVAYNYDGNSTSSSFGELTTVSAVGKNVVNLLKNHNLESASDWSVIRIADNSSTYTASHTADKAYYGFGSLKITVDDFAKNGSVSYAQTFTPDMGVLEIGETYTASAFINTSSLLKDSDIDSSRGYGAGVVVRVISDEGTNYLYSDSITETFELVNDGWERTFTTFTVPESYSRIDILLAVRNATGTAYFDCAQLEIGEVPNQYNLIENNGFNYIDSNGYAANWSRYNLESTDVVVNGEMKLVGNPDSKKAIHQDVLIGDSSQDENYVYSGWVKAEAVPEASGRYFAIYPMVYYKDANGAESREAKEVTYFDSFDSDEQYVSAPVSLAHSSDNTLIPFKIRILACYYRECNIAFFDNVALYPSEMVYDLTTDEKEEPVTTTDDNGNVTSCIYPDGTIYEYTYHTLDDGTFVVATEKIIGIVTGDDGEPTTETTIYTYDTSEKLTSVTYSDGNGNDTVYNYIYDSNGNLLSKLTANGIGDEYTYDADGNILTESYEDGSSYTYIYSENGNLIGKTETDAEGVKTAYAYSYSADDFNNLLSVSKNDTLLESYTYVSFDTNNDGINDKSAVATESLEDGTQNVYDYYSYNKLKTHTVTKNNTSITYHYDIEGQLTKVDHNGFSYNYEYDAFGNSTNVSVGNQSLISYDYQPDNSKAASVTYGNGSQLNFAYDVYGNVISKSGSIGNYTSKYDAFGKLIYENDGFSGRKTYYKYDELGNLYGEKVSAIGVGNSGNNFLYSSYDSFDENGNVTKNTLTSGERTLTTGYSYTESGLPLQTVIASSRKVNFAYDEEENLSSRTLTTNTPVVESFTYNDEGYISTHTVTHGEESDVYSYTYDANGNITEIKKDGVVQQSYVYDELNQLLRENNLDIGKTIAYIYDGSGNIESKTEYAFTTDSLENKVATDTVTYTYDGAWQDKLTSYDGQSITYDAIGNPTNYMGAEMTWFGRQMMSYETDDLDISYKYDSDGLRTQKVVNGIEHDYYYVDGQLRYERNGDSYEIYYNYDAEGRPTRAYKKDLVTGINYSYYLITNTRGDVVETRDGDGNVNAKFVYDSWGKLISVTDGNGNELGTDSFAYQISLKYRGYVYDSETELYYLQSRYYDPEVGRFLNADSVDYIGYSDSVISYNVFAYCENNAVNDSDYDGYISIQSVKDFFANIVSNIAIYIKNYIANLIKIENGVLIISTTVFEVTINAIISSFCAGKIVNAATPVLKYVLNKYKNKAPQRVVDILKYVIERLNKTGLIRTIAKFIATKLVVRKTVVKDSTISTIAKDFLAGILLSNSALLQKVNTICSAMSSIGGFISFLISGFDKNWFDGRLKINITSFKRSYL